MSTPISWQKATFSGGNGENCIEVGRQADSIVMRESDDPDLIITTSPAKLSAFIQGVKAGEFDHFVS
ncbi:DUF397 domain-containing protein [Streptomyces sp. NBC_00249]|uniref:DUF397 domain-containing protein n=1 Tax=Streptomyces sp. NBC_00249 TaxID=2975690 RepID=UPI00224FD970|nr:DUF397 domain-containing protein [Streptomyces sp. NBC_00249]MCX5198592.1 DUF397 domain-containing protein [Streptomyces sp. NBC_00249]